MSMGPTYLPNRQILVTYTWHVGAILGSTSEKGWDYGYRRVITGWSTTQFPSECSWLQRSRFAWQLDWMELAKGSMVSFFNPLELFAWGFKNTSCTRWKYTTLNSLNVGLQTRLRKLHPLYRAMFSGTRCSGGCLPRCASGTHWYILMCVLEWYRFD